MYPQIEKTINPDRLQTHELNIKGRALCYEFSGGKEYLRIIDILPAVKAIPVCRITDEPSLVLN